MEDLFGAEEGFVGMPLSAEFCDGHCRQTV